jgi:hypothetical protein
MENLMATVNPVRKWIVTGAIAGGALLGGAGIAAAATGGSTTATNSAATSSGSAASPTNPATVDHGPGETLLTGTTAAKVEAAALAAVPGGTIIRVETDSGGATYEAHMTKADGTSVTVKLDSNFKVTATQSGFGSGGPGDRAPSTAGA